MKPDISQFGVGYWIISQNKIEYNIAHIQRSQAKIVSYICIRTFAYETECRIISELLIISSLLKPTTGLFKKIHSNVIM